jgi:hypothetical protein
MWLLGEPEDPVTQAVTTYPTIPRCGIFCGCRCAVYQSLASPTPRHADGQECLCEYAKGGTE